MDKERKMTANDYMALPLIVLKWEGQYPELSITEGTYADLIELPAEEGEPYGKLIIALTPEGTQDIQQNNAEQYYGRSWHELDVSELLEDHIGNGWWQGSAEACGIPMFTADIVALDMGEDEYGQAAIVEGTKAWYWHLTQTHYIVEELLKYGKVILSPIPMEESDNAQFDPVV